MKSCPHCGSGLDACKGRPRSVPQLRRFFGVLRAMHAHWPEAHEFQPESEEHLRKWVLCKAGHREAVDIPCEFAGDAPAVTRLAALAIEAAIKAAGAFAFVRPDLSGGRVRVYKARSIAFDKLGPAEFSALNDEVEAVYRSETGLDPEQVLREEERAA